jgi:hypothetical protein
VAGSNKAHDITRALQTMIDDLFIFEEDEVKQERIDTD